MKKEDLMNKFSEVGFKMDKWAVDEFEVQNEFWNIIDKDISREAKISEMEDFLEVLVWSWDSLESYLEEDEEYTDRELAEYLVISNC